MKSYNKFFSSLLILSLLMSMFPVGASAATTETKTETVPIKFLASQRFNPSSTLKNISVNLNVPDGYKVKSHQIWKMVSDSSNNVKLSNQGTMSSQISGNQLNIPSFAGAKVTVEKPGYISTMNYKVNRRSNGKEWIVQGNGAGPYYVTPQASDPCWQGGITVCVGLLNKDNSGNSISSKLKTNEGWATETSRSVPAPSIFDFKNESIYKTALILSSVKIIKADPMTTFHKVLSTSNGDEPGTGKLTVATKLTKVNTIGEMKGCTGCSGLAGEMNYLMESLTYWEAQTYLYEGEVRVTYEKLPPKDKPLVECSCTVDPSTVQFTDKDISATSTLTASVKQKGTLKVKEWKLYGRLADGSQLQTQTLGPLDSVTNKFSFTIPKVKMKDVDSYTETYVMRAIIYFTDGTSADNTIECSTIVTKPGATPAPSPGSTPEPTPTPKPVLEIKAKWNPISIYTGETSTLSAEGKGYTDWSWEYSDNLNPLMRDATDLYYENIKFDEAGVYTAKITVTNDEGDSKSDTAILYVNDPKPVALISGVTRWVQGRAFPSLHHLNNSYTPLTNRGVTIDFSKSEIKYKKYDASDYIVGSWPDKAPMELGDYTLEGKVYDSQGRVSEWAQHPLEIVPDQPPIVEVFAAAEGVRNNDLIINIEADSPDGDMITHLSLEERYDSDNDGDFEEESWKLLYNGVFKSSHPAKYSTVGKRQYRAVVTEDFGLSGTSNIAQTDIINRAPQVDFTANGITDQPDQGEDSGPPITNYSAETISRSWVLKKPYVGGNEGKAGWKVNGSSLTTRNGVWADFHGNYNLANNLEKLTPWQLPTANGSQTVVPKLYAGYKMVYYQYGQYYPPGSPSESSTRPHIFTVVNAKTGTTIQRYEMSAIHGYVVDIHKDGDKVYLMGRDNVLTLVAFSGQVVETYPSVAPPVSNENESNGIFKMIISKDNKTAYFVLVKAKGLNDLFSQRRSVYLVKYSLTQKTALYTSLLYANEDTPVSIRVTGLVANTAGDAFVTFQHELITYQSGEPFYNRFSDVKSNGDAKNFYMDPGRISEPILSKDERYVYMSSLRILSGRYGLDHHQGVLIYDSVTRNMGFTIFYSDTVSDRYSTGEDFSPYDKIFSPAVNPIDGTVYVAPFMYRRGGTITKEGALLSYADPLLTKLKESASNKYDSDGGHSFSLYGRYYGPGSKPFYQPSGVLTWPWTGQKEYEGKRDYYPWLGFAIGDESHLWYEPLSTYSESFHTTIGNYSYHEGWTIDDMTQVAPDGSVYILATKRRYTPNGSYGRWTDEKFVIPFTGESSGDLPRLIDDNTVEVDSETWGGLFYDPNDKMRNQVLEFDVAVNDLTNNKTIGAAIQIQDEKNMYSVEWAKDNLTLYKVVKGQKSMLSQTPMLRSAGIPYSFKVEAIAGTIRVSVNGVKKLEATDSTYLRGSAGIMSLGQQQASFSKFKRTNYGHSVPEETFEAVLIGDLIDYKKLFTDPEADSKNAEEWSYKHDPSYFANPLGLSQYDGQMFTTTRNTLDKPGLFEITHRAQDKLNFASYQLLSEPVTKNLYVHRRPVAEPNVTFTGIVYPEGEALDYLTKDTSYDLDVPGRLADRLFRTRWADSNNWLIGERLLYNRPGVELIIQEQVKDIHGAWSYWEETRIFKETLPPVNQHPPSMKITTPNGNLNKPTVYITDPTIRWLYTDEDHDPQEEYRLKLIYMDNSKTALTINSIGDDGSYELAEGSIEAGRVVQVQGQVYSKGVWSEDSNKVYFIIDTAPLTTLLTFNGPRASQPIYTNNNRPGLKVATYDRENDPIVYVDYEVFHDADGALAVDTNTLTGSHHYTTSALKEGLHHWRARAFDSYLWGPYASIGYFFVDTVPPDDVDEQLDIEATAVTVKFNAFSDKAPSSGHASRTFYMQKVNSNGSLTEIDLDNNGTSEYSVVIPNRTQSYRVGGLEPGQDYRLTVIDYDIAGNQGIYAYIYFNTNRPPVGDFDWSPKPVFEGDTVNFLSNVSDPDEDELEVNYRVKDPSGITQSFSYTMGIPYSSNGPVIRMNQTGTWEVTLTVSDGIALPVMVKKNVQVLPLTVTGKVQHTPLWDNYRKEYNKSKSGSEDSPRGYEVFWAGEKFMLVANTTDTGTATKADRVEVTMGKFSTTLSTVGVAKATWTGDLWDASFEKFKAGPLTFLFTAYYNNGVIKRESVVVTIDGTIYDILGVHRVK